MVIGPTELQSNPGAPSSAVGRAASFPVSPVAPVTRQPGSSTSNPPQAPDASEVALSSSNGTDSVSISQSALSAADTGSAPVLTASADQFTPSTAVAPENQGSAPSAETPQTAGGYAGTAPSNNTVPPVNLSATSELTRGNNVNVIG